MDNFIQITVFCPPEPRLGAFVYRNAGKIYYGQNSRKLSDDPDKVIAISFVMRQRCFPHVGMFSFLHRECINLHEGSLRNNMHLHSTLKGCFFVLKDFDQSQELKTVAKKSLQFYMFPT